MAAIHLTHEGTKEEDCKQTCHPEADATHRCDEMTTHENCTKS